MPIFRCETGDIGGSGSGGFSGSLDILNDVPASRSVRLFLTSIEIFPSPLPDSFTGNGAVGITSITSRDTNGGDYLVYSDEDAVGTTFQRNFFFDSAMVAASVGWYGYSAYIRGNWCIDWWD